MTDLSSALIEYLRTADDVRKAEASCPYDRSYFLSSDYEQLERAERRFVSELAKSIEEHQTKDVP